MLLLGRRERTVKYNLSTNQALSVQSGVVFFFFCISFSKLWQLLFFCLFSVAVSGNGKYIVPYHFMLYKRVTYTFHFKCGFFNENIVMSVHAKQVHINMRLHLSHINIHAWIHISTQSQFSDHLCDGWWMQWINFICEGSDKSCIFGFFFSPTIFALRC